MKKAIVIILVIISNQSILAQISSGGKPLSFIYDLKENNIKTLVLPSPDLNQIAEEDFLAGEEFSPNRFAVLLPVHVNLADPENLTEFADGNKIYRLKIKVNGSLACGLYYGDFNLTAGSKLFIYDESGEQLKGAYTSLNNDQSRLFATELIFGDAVVLELNCTKWSGIPSVLISEYAYCYRNIPQYSKGKGFGGSDFCEVNIACDPEGTGWQDKKCGIVRIQVRVSGSAYWCTGSLINNAKNDNTPYILTADHCAFQSGYYATPQDLDQWLFYFNYESTTCEDPVVEPPLKSMVGAEKIAQGGNRGYTGSDFYLVRLNQQVPNEFQPYFNGWSALDEASANGITVHHPEGDIKKMSVYNTPVQSSNWPGGSGVQSHWKVFWAQTQNGWGVTEPGSSGSPLFNSQGKIIGTLTGGYSACEASGGTGPDQPDFYGKFSYHWQSNSNADTAKLKPWLDPENSGVIQLEGKLLDVANVKSKTGSINIFPNPVASTVNINFINFEPSDVSMVIFNSLGKLIKSYECKKAGKNSLTIDISELPAGIYTLIIYYEDASAVEKIIKYK